MRIFKKGLVFLLILSMVLSTQCLSVYAKTYGISYGINVKVQTTRQLQFSFTPVKGAQSYKIWINGSKYETSNTSVNLTGLNLAKQNMHHLEIVPVIRYQDDHTNKYDVMFMVGYDWEIKQYPKVENLDLNNSNQNSTSSNNNNNSQGTKMQPKNFRVILVRNIIEGGRLTQNKTTSIKGGKIYITAIPNKGYVFKGWDLNNDGKITVTDPKETITVYKDRIIRGYFVKKDGTSDNNNNNTQKSDDKSAIFKVTVIKNIINGGRITQNKKECKKVKQ